MVGSRQVEIPYHRAVGRQRGRGFGALAQIIGRTAIPFLRKYVVPAAKRVGADLLEFAVPEIAEVVSGRMNFKTAAKSVGKQTLKKQLGEGSRKKTGSRIFPTNLLNNPVGREETFLQAFLVDHVKQQFSVPTFCGSVWKSWKESPNCWQCPVLAWTRNLSNYLTGWKLHSSTSITLTWDSLFWHWSSNLSRVVVTIHTRVRKRKRSTKMSLLFHWNRKRWRRGRRSTSSYLCKQHNAFDFFKCWSVH